MDDEDQIHGTAAGTAARTDAFTPGELERLILEEGPLSAHELAALGAEVRASYMQSQARRLEQLGVEEFVRQVRKFSGRSPAPAPRPIDDRTLRLFLEFYARR